MLVDPQMTQMDADEKSTAKSRSLRDDFKEETPRASAGLILIHSIPKSYLKKAIRVNLRYLRMKVSLSPSVYDGIPEKTVEGLLRNPLFAVQHHFGFQDLCVF